jgi:hypothetical protein
MKAAAWSGCAATHRVRSPTILFIPKILVSLLDGQFVLALQVWMPAKTNKAPTAENNTNAVKAVTIRNTTSSA